jgi:hypothetical protein
MDVTVPGVETAAADAPSPGNSAAYTMPGACPVCGDQLAVVRLECGHCGTAVVGRYRASRFARLSVEQVALLEAFLRSRGNIRKVERELGISYPTVRSRLNALLAALGIASTPDEEDEAVQRRRKEILDQLETGAIRPEDAARLLRQVGR